MKITTWKARYDRDISLRQLEELTGISKSTLNNIENGKTDPTIGQLEKIAIALEVKIRDIVISDYL